MVYIWKCQSGVYLETGTDFLRRQSGGITRRRKSRSQRSSTHHIENHEFDLQQSDQWPSPAIRYLASCMLLMLHSVSTVALPTVGGQQECGAASDRAAQTKLLVARAPLHRAWGACKASSFDSVTFLDYFGSNDPPPPNAMLSARQLEVEREAQRWNPVRPSGVGRRMNIDTTAGEQMAMRAQHGHRHCSKPAEHCMPSWPQTPERLNPDSAWPTGKAVARSPPRARLNPSHRSYGCLAQLWEVDESVSTLGHGQQSRFTAQPDESLSLEYGSLLPSGSALAHYHASAAHRTSRQACTSQPVSAVAGRPSYSNYAQHCAVVRVAAMPTRHSSAPKARGTGRTKEMRTISDQLQSARAERAAESAAADATAAVAPAAVLARSGGDTEAAALRRWHRDGGTEAAVSSLNKRGEKSELEELRSMGVGNATFRAHVANLDSKPHAKLAPGRQGHGKAKDAEQNEEFAWIVGPHRGRYP